MPEFYYIACCRCNRGVSVHHNDMSDDEPFMCDCCKERVAKLKRMSKPERKRFFSARLDESETDSWE